MHDVLRERLLRKLEVLPEQQLYEVLDYIEFLEHKYAAGQARQPDSLQRFAERLEDGMRMRSVAPKVISGTVGVIGSARKVMKTVSDMGKTVTDMGKTVTDAGRDLLTPSPTPSPAGPSATPAPSAPPHTEPRDESR